MLDTSWIRYYEEENFIDTFKAGCLAGAGDFQKKAIEELKKQITSSKFSNIEDVPIAIQVHNLAIQQAIKIIKDLKAY